MSCGVVHKCCSDLALLWLSCRLVGYNTDLTPILGTSACCWCIPKNQKKKKKERERAREPQAVVSLVACRCELGDKRLKLEAALGQTMKGPCKPVYRFGFSSSNLLENH